MARTSPASETEKRLTPQQEKVLGMFDGEALTAAEVAMNLRKEITGVRQQLRSLVTGKHLETTKRGRVVFYHKHGVEAPNEERRTNGDNAADFGGFNEGNDDETVQDDDKNDAPDDADDEAAETPEVGQHTDAPETSRGHARPSARGEHIEEADPRQAIPQFDEAQNGRATIGALFAQTPKEQLPLIEEALAHMSELRGNHGALRDFYEHFFVDHGIDEHTLIRWHIALFASGYTPSDFREALASVYTPEPPPAAAAATDDGKDDDQDNRETVDKARDPMAREADVLDVLYDVSRQDPPHPLHPTVANTLHMNASIDRHRQSTGYNLGRLAVNPRISPRHQMEIDVYSKPAVESGNDETDLAGTLCEIGGRLTDAEWAEYESIVHLSEIGAVQPAFAKRFSELFFKAHRAIPGADCAALANLILIAPDARTKVQSAEYELLAKKYLHGA